jgi:tripartite-type tricarboxylate transporter receptor subunit TctC
VVENRSGANGGIAVNALIGSPADGQTFLVTDGAILSMNPQVYGKLSYDPKDVAPVAYLAQAFSRSIRKCRSIRSKSSSNT